MNKPLDIILPSSQTMDIVLVGCGGTGSFIAQDLARLAYHQLSKGIELNITFVDFDVVEEKNVGRQNFVASEIGKNKAEVLALRYNRAYGLKIESSNKPIQTFKLDSKDQIFIIVGAVDNNKARKIIHNNLKHFYGDYNFWLDCGNYNNGGQILLGNSFSKGNQDYKLNLIKYIPYPSIQMPELIKKETKIKISCAEAAIREEQTLMINRAMAVFAGQYLYDLIVKRQTNKYQTFISLGGCSATTKFLGKEIWEY